jgi:hypothetical protein
MGLLPVWRRPEFESPSIRLDERIALFATVTLGLARYLIVVVVVVVNLRPYRIWLRAMRFPILVLHVSAGILSMLAGAFAISFRKGSRRHRTARNLFVICMLIVSAAGAWLAFRKSEPDNVLGGINAFYLVATAWATAKRRATKMWAAEWSAPPFALLVAAIWIAWAVEVTRGRMSAGQNSSAGGYLFFGVLALLCAVGDVRMLLRGLSERQRLLRHLWRMCFGYGLSLRFPSS